MSVDQYWKGKGLDLESLWNDFDAGSPYARKVADAGPLHLLRLTFGHHPTSLPLFDHEVVYKTVQGTFHDIKAECFTKDAYDAATPIFLYRIERGSGVFEFLAQFDPLITWVVALGGAAMWYRKALKSDQDFDDKRLTFIKTHFPNASNADVRAYMKAWTTAGRRKVLDRLLGQCLERVEVSSTPLLPEKPLELIDMKDIVLLEHRGGDADSGPHHSM